MKKIIFTGLSIMSLFLLIACGEKETKQTSSPKQPAVQQIAVGKDAPDFTLHLSFATCLCWYFTG